jgi:hypothetical protein
LRYINRAPDLSREDERSARTARLQRACAREKEAEGWTENVLVYSEAVGKTASRELTSSRDVTSRRAAKCVVPKAGCTFWIRVFRFLNNDTNGVHVR